MRLPTPCRARDRLLWAVLAALAASCSVSISVGTGESTVAEQRSVEWEQANLRRRGK